MSGTSTADLLIRSRAGDRHAFDAVYTRVYDDLLTVARGQRRRVGGSDTLDTTSLVHEAYFRLVDERSVPWECRAHFLAIAARAMRRAAVDYIRERGAQKRGGNFRHVALTSDIFGEPSDPETLIAIDTAIAGLAKFNDRLAQVAECRLFGGLTESETAEALTTPLRTVQRDWQRARAWIQQALRD